MTDLDEISASDLRRLLGISRQGLSELVAGGVIKRAARRGRYLLVPSVSGYVEHLRQSTTTPDSLWEPLPRGLRFWIDGVLRLVGIVSRVLEDIGQKLDRQS
jgi:hypothetical protein